MACTVCGDAVGERGDALGNGKGEGDDLAAVGREGDAPLLCGQWLVGIEPFQVYIGCQGGVTAVRDLHGKVALIALVEEAWSIGLYHKGLACDEAARYAAMLQVFGVGDALDVPAGKQVGSGEPEGGLSLCIGAHDRKE